MLQDGFKIHFIIFECQEETLQACINGHIKEITHKIIKSTINKSMLVGVEVIFQNEL